MGFKIKKGKLTCKFTAKRVRMPTPFKDGRKIYKKFKKSKCNHLK